MKKTKLTRSLLAACSIVALSAVLSACVHSGGGDTEDPPTTMEPMEPDPDPALGEAQTAADMAADAAETAASAAEMAANAQTANMSADEGSYALAQNSAMRARTAASAARAASDAAAATDDTAAAQAQQAIAETKQAEAMAEQANAEKYAGMVATAQQALDDEAQRVLDVAAARGMAMTSYMAADADATKAEMQADEAEEAADGTPGAVAARTAATAARTAATAAKAAHDAITGDMSKADADAQAAMAATEAGKANTAYMTAKAENDTIQTASGISNEQNRVRDVAAATTAAGEAATDARTAATNARTHATNARTAANAAKASYERAKSARTNSKEAMAQYMAAKDAATAAENAATAAEMAATAAETAHTGIDADGSAADAQAAQTTAETRKGGREHVAELHYRLRKTPVAANDTVGALSRMLNRAEAWGLVPAGSNPCRFVTPYRTRRLERFLTEEEFARLGHALDELETGGRLPVHAAAALRLLMLTGCRCGEVLTLRWEDVALERNEIRLRDSKTGPRVVPLSPAAARVLAGIPRPPDNPWVIAGREPGARQTHIADYWYRVRERAGLDDVRLHDLRHSFASRALALGEDLTMIGKLLGHKKIQTTARYAHLARDSVKESAALVAASIGEDILP